MWKKDKTVIDITEGNRRNVNDARDCGGRIGPYVGEGQPDLRNASIYWTICEEDDMLIVVSDGVHDNFDPQVLGKTPNQLESKCPSEWEKITDYSVAEQLKTNHMISMLSNQINGDEEIRKERMKIFSFNNDEDAKEVPLQIANRVLKYCLSVTGKGRQWMEQNPKDKLPNDYQAFPGKMDHATCNILRIGQYENILLNLANQNQNQNQNQSQNNKEKK